jgi:glutathione S-transferase
LSLLAGGYRRIPVAQIGADIYCDTALISQQIIARATSPLAADSEAVVALADHAEQQAFFAAIRQNSQLKTAMGLILKLGFKGMMAFAKDRATFAVGYAPAMLTPAEARAVFRQYLEDLASNLSSALFLGGHTPCVGDFRCYHPIFLAVAFQSVKEAQLPQAVRAWMKRVEAFGWGQVSVMTDLDALEVARAETPELMSEAATAHADVGEWVTVSPTDTGKVPVTGTLVGMDAERISLLRRSEDVGDVHVHFPTAGFECIKINQ